MSELRNNGASAPSQRIVLTVLWPPLEEQPDPDGYVVPTYSYIGVTLPEPHGPDCPCLVCDDTRKDWGHRERIIDPWDLVGKTWIV